MKIYYSKTKRVILGLLPVVLSSPNADKLSGYGAYRQGNVVKKIRIFIASPGDVSEERDIVSNIVIPEVRRIFSDAQMIGNGRAVDIEPIRWETHAWPAVGEDAQQVINQEIGEYDLLVGLMWKKFGTPTKRAGSGTGEEFERAYEYFKAYKRPYIMFYFRTTPFYPTTAFELSQFRKVLQFRRKLEQLGVLYWEYTSPLYFERDVREHLIRQIAQLLRPAQTTLHSSDQEKTVLKQKKPAKQPLVFFSYDRVDYEIIRPIYASLREAGFQPWLDVEALLPGQDWQFEVKRAIGSADIVLAFISAKSVARSGFFGRELQMAVEMTQEKLPNKVFLIPVRLDPVEPPAPLKQYQWIDYFVEGGPERLIFTIRKVAQNMHK